MRRAFLILLFLSAGTVWADSVTLKSGRVINGEILDEWEGRILMEVKKGITMIFERKDVKKVVKDRPPPPPVKKPAVKKPAKEESSSVSSSTSSTTAAPVSPPAALAPEKAPAPAPTPAPAPEKR